MLGQNGHFQLYAPEKIPYAIDRYSREARRLYGVLDAHLGEGRDYIAGDYSIADMACFPWIMTHKAQGMTLDDFPSVKRWYALLRARPRLQAGLAVGKQSTAPMDEQARKIMFGVDAPAYSQQQ
jgi:GST-like protein